ncbi:hypothetical protein N799_09915 [Lysobacter arseniciresistens ZS79]|uniref:Uncharacterized protein n=2 Tax=Novilysobacter TaxID=3382699 RepID=A0A0A0EYH3_9GAMM|nr:hypothetical protein N799_09915 [Lysobacter arseniciresistens ZS79]
MVVQALAAKVPQAFRSLQAAGELDSFADFYAVAMVERIHEVNDPSVALRIDGPLLERARRIKEIRDRAVEQVLADMLSTESLKAATTTSQPED